MNNYSDVNKVCSVSMNRSGSTFFVTTLSTVPGFAGDFEIQVAKEIPSPMHRSLWENSLREIHDSIVFGQKNIRSSVSKIVIAPQHEFSFQSALPLLLRELQKMSSVVVIIRPWYEQFYSKYLGGGHLTSEPDRLPKYIKISHTNKKFFEERFEMSERELSVEHLLKDLKKREKISSNLLGPISRLENATLVEYKNIHAFLKSFIGEYTELSHDKIDNYVTGSPTKKLHSPSDEDLFLNFSEISKIKDYWNSKYLENVLFLKNNANSVFE